MNPKIKKTAFILVLLSVYVISSAFFYNKKGGCDSDGLYAEAVLKLKKYTLIEEYPFYIKKKKKSGPIEFKKQIITLNNGVKYKFFTVKNPEYDGQPILSIYNNEKQEFLLGSTYNASMKKFYNEIEFECKSTGNYCLSLSFHDGQEGCAIGIFASLIKAN